MLKTVLKWALGLILTLVVVVGGFVGVAAWRFNTALPQIEGEARLPGADGEIVIVRDRYGVPHIFAETEADLYRGLGYAHAQDRFFQMDLTRRAMQGRLSELLGDLTVEMDARARIMGWSAVAEAQFAALSPEARAGIEAYAEGVNAQLAEDPPPPEYAVLFADREPWRPTDSLAVSLAMTETLTSGAQLERTRERLAGVLTEEQIGEFLAAYPDFAPTSYQGADLMAALQAAPVLESDRPGSNAWVVSGSRTATGAPMLANDPHLPLAAPGPFYLSRLQGPDGPLIGASLPGAPSIVIGRTNTIAWGTTTHAVDAEDDVMLTPEMTVTTTEEVVRVRRWIFFYGEERINVRRTELGPVLDCAWFDFEGLYEGQDVVLRTIADDVDNGVAEAVYRASKADSVADYIEALAPWTAPPQNLVVADVQGAIGLVSPGRFPERDMAGQWQGQIGARLYAINPEAGFLATANNLQTPRDFAYPMPGGHDPFRVTRIADVLSADDSVTLADMAALQLDQTSVLALRVMPALAQARPQTGPGQELQARLAAWDGVARATAVEPTLFAYWTRAFGERLYADELGEALFPRYVGPRDVFLDGVLTGAISARWCDDVTTGEVAESCAQTIAAAMDDAAAALIADRGGDQANWGWGDVHAARFPHPFFSQLPVLRDRYTILTPFGGNSTTVNVARNWHSQAGYNTVHAAGMRMIIDFSDLNGSLFMMAPGQSGIVSSPHFSDLAYLWSQGDYIQIRDDWTPAEAPSGARTLRLRP